jgi:hypothetical protein
MYHNLVQPISSVSGMLVSVKAYSTLADCAIVCVRQTLYAHASTQQDYEMLPGDGIVTVGKVKSGCVVMQ